MGQANVQLELLSSCVYPGVESGMNCILLIVLAEGFRAAEYKICFHLYN